MSQLSTTAEVARVDAHEWQRAQALQADLLIDAIAGRARADLEGLSVAQIYNALVARIEAMGMRPAEQKVLRVAHWIFLTPSSTT